VAAGKREAPTCTDCHSEHKIEALKNSSSLRIAAEICSDCHASERLNTKYNLPPDRVKTFFESYHGLAAQYGSTLAANCASCHGVHNILASSDPKSTINAKNLPQTCGKCHPGAGTRFAISQVHVMAGGAESAAVKWVREFYLVLIPATIGLMLLHNLGDWWRKLMRARFAGRVVAAARERAAHREMRMLPFERVQHAVQHGQLLAGGVHDVDVLGEGLPDRPGEGLGPPVLDETPADLPLDGLAQLVDAGPVLVADEALLERLTQRRHCPSCGRCWPAAGWA